MQRKSKLNARVRRFFCWKKECESTFGCGCRKAYCRLVMQQPKEQGVSSALINLGGNVLTLDQLVHHEDGNWWLGFKTLNSCGENAALLPIQDESHCTSGVYERVLEVGWEEIPLFWTLILDIQQKQTLRVWSIVSKQSVIVRYGRLDFCGKSTRNLIRSGTTPNIEAVLILEDDRIFHYYQGLLRRFNYSKGSTKWLN